MNPDTIYTLAAPTQILGEAANAIRIRSVIVHEFTHATCSVEVGVYTPARVVDDEALPASFTPLANRSVDLTAEEYSQWGDDDRYIFEIAAARLGLTLSPASA